MNKSQKSQGGVSSCSATMDYRLQPVTTFSTLAQVTRALRFVARTSHVKSASRPSNAAKEPAAVPRWARASG
jgi:hypothetical protein